MQARIKQLASEAAGTFDFEVGQAAKIADRKMRWRLPRVFGTGELESAEETLARCKQRTSTQPPAKSFAKNKVHGIKEATTLLARNVKFIKK